FDGRSLARMTYDPPRNAFEIVLVGVIVLGTVMWIRRPGPPALRWVIACGFVLTSVVQPLQECGTEAWIRRLGWVFGWMMYPVCCGLLVPLLRGDKRTRIVAAIVLIAFIAYGQVVMRGATRLCEPPVLSVSD